MGTLNKVAQAGGERFLIDWREVERGRGGEDLARVEAGRAAGEVAPQPEQLRRRPKRVSNGEAQVAQRAFVGVEPQDLGGGRGAHEGEAAA